MLPEKHRAHYQECPGLNAQALCEIVSTLLVFLFLFVIGWEGGPGN